MVVFFICLVVIPEKLILGVSATQAGRRVGELGIGVVDPPWGCYLARYGRWFSLREASSAFTHSLHSFKTLKALLECGRKYKG